MFNFKKNKDIEDIMNFLLIYGYLFLNKKKINIILVIFSLCYFIDEKKDFRMKFYFLYF